MPRAALPHRAFSRNGTLSPDLLLILLLYMVADANRRGYSQLVDAFWDEAKSFGLSLPTQEPVSGVAFCKARRKLPTEVIRTLVHRVADRFDGRFGGAQRWIRGRRVFAVDGTKINLQRGDDLAEAFGVPHGACCPQVLVSTLFELTTKVPHDLVIGRYDSSEREQLIGLLDRLRPGDVLVLDRGYPSYEVLCILIDAGIDFVIRVPDRSTFKAVDDFLDSGGDDYRILVTPAKDHPMRERGALEVRALRITAPTGEETILLTSLRRASFTRSQVGDLYRIRWEIEEYYKLVKGDYLGQGQFHGKSPDGVRQEIHAVALYVAITRFLMAAAAVEHDVPFENVSPKSGVLGLAAYITRLLLACDPNDVTRVLDRLLERVARRRVRKRHGRRCPRRSFQPLPKWGPAGRRGG